MVKRYGLATILSFTFIGAGFLVLFFAWFGASGVDCTQCQIPYLLSGGATGLGLIGLGAALLLFEAGRRTIRRLEQKLEALTEVVRETPPSSNGHKPSVVAASHDAGVEDGMVVIGRSSFHTTDCRLVVGKDDMAVASLGDATARGLSPCRLCEPTKVTVVTSKSRR